MDEYVMRAGDETPVKLSSRAEGFMDMDLTVFLETNRYQPQEPQYYNHICLPMPIPTEFTAEIIGQAEKGIEAIFREGYLYRKVGVRLEGLVPSETLQQGLFSRYPQERIHPLMKALDDVNGLYGPGTLRYGSEGFEKPWKMRQKHLSQPIVTGRGSEFQNARPVCELGTSVSLVRSMVLK